MAEAEAEAMAAIGRAQQGGHPEVAGEIILHQNSDTRRRLRIKMPQLPFE